MKTFICFLISLIFLSSIYDISLNDHNGNNINLNQFRGKKILFVNTSSSSIYSDQYRSLETLYQKYKDSLVIIATPSNSFGHETGQVQQIIDEYNIHYIISETLDITGNNQTPLYSWLTHISQNGVMNTTIHNDFYKFLIDGSGNFAGAFVSSVDPMSDAIQRAITNN